MEQEEQSKRRLKWLYVINRLIAGGLFLGLVGATIKYLPPYFTKLRYQSQLEKEIWEGVVTSFVERKDSAPIVDNERGRTFYNKCGLYVVNTLGYRDFEISISETDLEKFLRLEQLFSASGYDNQIWRENSWPAKGAGPVKIKLPNKFKEAFGVAYTPSGTVKSQYKYRYYEITLDDILEINGRKFK